MKKLLKWLTPAAMAATFFAAYTLAYRHVIIFHEQHHLFRFDADYISRTAHEYGLWHLLTEFTVQFAYYPLLGAAVWTLILTATYLMTRSAIRRLTGLTDRLQLSAIPPVVQFFASVNVDRFPTLAIQIFCGAAVAWVLALIFGRFIPRKFSAGADSKSKRITAWCGPLIFAAIFGLGYQYFYRGREITLPSGKVRAFTSEEIRGQRRMEQLMMSADQAMRRNDWDEVLACCNEQALTGRPNHLMDYFRAMALYHKGLLIDHLFDTPQRFGIRSIFFPWKADRNQAEYGGYLYEQLGAINTAIHWEFEALVGWGETSRHLINLSRYYILTDKPLQAEKFIAPLRKTLFYRSEARELDRMIAEGRKPLMHNAVEGIKSPRPRWDSVLDFTVDAAYILRHDPGNAMAREYLMMGLLLENKLGAFYEFLKREYPPAETAGKPLPRVFQQALCLVRLQVGAEQIAADGYSISPETEAAYSEYLKRHSRGKAAIFSPAQKQTLWYYIHFISPAGNQLIF